MDAEIELPGDVEARFQSQIFMITLIFNITINLGKINLSLQVSFYLFVFCTTIYNN